VVKKKVACLKNPIREVFLRNSHNISCDILLHPAAPRVTSRWVSPRAKIRKIGKGMLIFKDNNTDQTIKLLIFKDNTSLSDDKTNNTYHTPFTGKKMGKGHAHFQRQYILSDETNNTIHFQRQYLIRRLR